MLTQIQRDAMARAQAGDFSLADAIEVLSPGRADYNGARLIGGARQGGRLQFFVYGEPRDCEECEGGEVECQECGHVTECEACDGTGIDDASLGRDSGAWKYVLNLNEDVIYDVDEDDVSDTPPLEVSLTPGKARAIIAAYEAEGAKASEPAQPSPADTEQAVAA